MWRGCSRIAPGLSLLVAVRRESGALVGKGRKEIARERGLSVIPPPPLSSLKWTTTISERLDSVDIDDST